MNDNNAFVTELNGKIDQYLETGEYEKIEETSRELCRLQGLDVVNEMPDDFLFQMKKKEKRNMGIIKRKHNKKENATEEKRVHTRSISKAGLAACVLCAVVLVSVPVAAGVNSVVTKRMEKMSRKEQQELLDANDSRNMTKDKDASAVAYSRKLSEEEEARFDKLRNSYEEEGLFPEEELQIVDKLEANTEISSPVYETYNREIFLPERELTDEELLEIFDFFQKSDYAISHTDEAQKAIKGQHDFEENPNPGENDLSEEEAVAKASEYLEKIYNIDTASMDKKVEFVLGHGLENDKYGSYEIVFTDGKQESYGIEIHGETGILTTLWLVKDGLNYRGMDAYGAPVAVNEKFLVSHYEEAKDMITGLFGSELNVEKGTCEYSKDEEGNAKDGCIIYTFEMSNGYVYYVLYTVDRDVFGHIYLTEVNGWNPSLHAENYEYVVLSLE